MTGFNGIGWFEIGTDDPAAAEQFYGDVFGWTIAHDDTAGPTPAYQFFTTGDPAGLHGGLFATEGKLPNYAVFAVLVENVESACRKVEGAGGKVLGTPQTNPSGVSFAHLLDPSGNHFEVFTPAPAQP
jgi:hypothetical protein